MQQFDYEFNINDKNFSNIVVNMLVDIQCRQAAFQNLMLAQYAVNTKIPIDEVMKMFEELSKARYDETFQDIITQYSSIDGAMPEGVRGEDDDDDDDE